MEKLNLNKFEDSKLENLQMLKGGNETTPGGTVETEFFTRHYESDTETESGTLYHGGTTDWKEPYG